MSAAPEDDDVLYQEYTLEYGEKYISDKIEYNVNTLTRPAAVLSLLGSTYIIYDILKHSFRGGCNCTKRNSNNNDDNNNNNNNMNNSNSNRNANNSSRGLTKMANRIMLALSTCDAISSLMYLLATWPVPKGQAYGAYGTKGTCTLQGFLTWYFVPTARLYNATLAICYVLMVRYGWMEEQLRRIQLFFLLAPHSFGLLVAVPLLVDEAYNFNQQAMCGPSTFPTWCDRDATYEDDDETPCLRGGNLSVGGTKLGTVGVKVMAPMDICLSGFIIVVCMIILYWTVRARERRNERYDFARRAVHAMRRTSSSDRRNSSSGNWRRNSSQTSTGGTRRASSGEATTGTAASRQSRRRLMQQASTIRRRQSSMVAMQGILYSLAYWATVGPFFTFMAVWWLGQSSAKRPQWLSPTIVITLPLQGALNALVYLRPRFVMWCREQRQQRRRRRQRAQQRRLQAQEEEVIVFDHADGGDRGTKDDHNADQDDVDKDNPSSQPSPASTLKQNSSSTPQLPGQLEPEDEAISAFLSVPATTAPPIENDETSIASF